MTYSFIEAQREWKRLLADFIAKNSKIPKVAERSQILLTVPKGMEQEFKDLAKLRRQQADETLPTSTEGHSLALQFEKANPPPKRSDYE